MYGAFVWGVLPIEPGVSWETHLAGALIGIVLAFLFRHLDVPPRRRYSWESEVDAEDEPPAGDGEGEPDAGENPRPTLH
jgi:hypothetical protein